jgi:hypothetical protein
MLPIAEPTTVEDWSAHLTEAADVLRPLET